MRVLCVEDDREMAELLERALVERQHVVRIERDGESARHAALTDEFDVILLDLMLPKIDGIGVCHAIRRAGKWTPIIMLTARDAIDDRVLGLEAGADDYLVKPFALAELHARIAALRRRAEQRMTDTLEVGDLVLDPSRTWIELGGRRVELTAREFSLLRYFMRHPERALSKSEILENVWDANYDGLGNVVEVYVNYLRNKLESFGGPRRIETVRGRGYVLREMTS